MLADLRREVGRLVVDTTGKVTGKVHFGGENEVTWAGKRALGIGDQLLLERRAADLASDCGVPVGALDLGLHNWGSGHRFGDGCARR